jgi:hypothetical protein
VGGETLQLVDRVPEEEHVARGVALAQLGVVPQADLRPPSQPAGGHITQPSPRRRRAGGRATEAIGWRGPTHVLFDVARAGEEGEVGVLAADRTEPAVLVAVLSLGERRVRHAQRHGGAGLEDHITQLALPLHLAWQCTMVSVVSPHARVVSGDEYSRERWAGRWQGGPTG